MKPLWLALAPLALVGATTADKPAPTTATMGPVTSKFAPLQYFEDNCARCHGDYGSAYGPEFGAHLSDAQMRQEVKDMAEGPGGAPLEQEQLDLETAWHESLRDKRPFGVVTGWKNGTLTGEATPGAKIWLTSPPGLERVAVLTGHGWKLKLEPAPQWKDARLHVKVGDKEAVIELAPGPAGHTP